MKFPCLSLDNMYLRSVENLRPFSLGPERVWRLASCPGFVMRFNRDVRKSVVFLGYPDFSKGPNGIRCEGTGFLLLYKNTPYLVTARHVADLLGETGCVARINKNDGTSANVDGDIVRWYFHPDRNVDVALTPFGILPEWGFDSLYLEERMILTQEKTNTDYVELGDLCYTVGLFRVLVGDQRNLPVVHTGNLARMAGEEPIRLLDKTAPSGRQLVDGFLVETQSLSGLSGAPVFVRRSIRLGITGTPEGSTIAEPLELVVYKDEVSLLGIWQADWEAPAGEVIAVDRGKEITVPVGMGVVVPATKIVDVLEMAELKQMREEAAKRRANNEAAVPQSVSGHGAPHATDENPTHLEDFNRLVDVAARKRPQGDQT
jgi:hypothetical protein